MIFDFCQILIQAGREFTLNLTLGILADKGIQPIQIKWNT